MILPSKELFKEVTGITVENIHYGVYKGNVEYSEHGRINIYELMNKMKQWALGKGFYVLSMIDEFGGMALVSTKKNSNIHNKVANEEAEAVFKICEWILKKKLQP